MKHTKKLLSLLLAAVMLVGMIPAISVNAAEAPTTATAVPTHDGIEKDLIQATKRHESEFYAVFFIFSHYYDIMVSIR